MKKKLVILAVVILAAFMLTACGGHKINIVGGEDDIVKCPRRAKAGETVTIETMIVCDADLYLSVNGDKEFGHWVTEGVYEFEMPESDVDVKVWVISNGLA